MISIAVVRYNLANLISNEICDAIYVPWSGFEKQPIWSCNPGLYSIEPFNTHYDIEATNDSNWRVITGGEPFLQGGIERFMSMMYEAIGCPIRLDTDGTNPYRIKKVIIEETIAHIALRIWVPPSQYNRYRLVSNDIIDQSIHELMNAPSHEVIIPYDPNYTKLNEILEEISKLDIENITIQVLGEIDKNTPDVRYNIIYEENRYDPKLIIDNLTEEFKNNSKINITY